MFGVRSFRRREEIRERLKTKKPNKYGAKPTRGFASKLEAAVYDILIERQSRGELSDIKRQQTVVLQDGPAGVRIAWKVDFSYMSAEDGRTVYVEAKGLETNDYVLKVKLWRNDPPYELEIYRGNWDRPRLVERIVTKQKEEF